MAIYTVEVEIKIEADSPEEASANVLYSVINESRCVDFGITCEPYEA